MPITSDNAQLDVLTYSIYDMLGVAETEALAVESVAGTTTAVTLRVTRLDHGDATFFVKTIKRDNNSEVSTNLGIREVRFYEFIDSLDPELYPSIPKCVRRHVSGDGRRYYLVLEDLSASHTDYRDVDFADLESWKCALRFHRRFAGKLTQDRIEAHTDDREERERYIEKLERAYDQFRAYSRDRVDESIFSLMEESIPVLREIEVEKYARIMENKVTTLVHRDAHVRNFLYPRGKDETAKIVDWQFWGVGIGTYDLRHLLGSALDKEMRQHQKDLVRYYYQIFTQGKPGDYSWEACWEDYRRGVIDNLFMPVWQYAGFGWEYERWADTLGAAVENYYELNIRKSQRRQQAPRRGEA